MFKTIFSKNFTIYICVILASFIVLATSLSQIYKAYFIERQEKLLLEHSEKVANLFFESAWVQGPFEILKYRSLIDEEAKNLKEYLDYNYLLIDKDFSILYSTEHSLEELAEKNYTKIDIEALPMAAEVMQGSIISFEGTLAGLYNEPKLTVCYPIGDGEVFIGAIFMSSSMESLNENISGVVSITTSGVIISCFLAFFMIYISSNSMARPLKQMNEAAKVIANGDFEKRIEVNSVDEIGQLAESFNYMAAGLEEQETSRKEFIANISHDLRSPLTSIIGFLQAIKDGTIPPERTDYYLGIVLDECKRLAKIANDLLDISKIQLTGKLEIMAEDFELNKLMRDTINQFEKRIVEKNMALEISFADRTNIVHADYEKIQRVVYNLLDNAVKFTPQNGRIKIETTINDKKVFVSIKDSGKGLSEAERQHIFERFYKVDSSRGMDKSGSGLGLSIVREFIKAHDEKIFVNSEEGMGCEFIFTLSLTQQEKPRKKDSKTKE
ncbi:HAMP domain-containing histidine kinase [Tyzzerella sp. OttesenSCG-928-J15]|nr:HAMP domain-containing histidine kinase [Tyzzerella sp. OttesenSCG-928-J15]